MLFYPSPCWLELVSQTLTSWTHSLCHLQPHLSTITKQTPPNKEKKTTIPSSHKVHNRNKSSRTEMKNYQHTTQIPPHNGNGQGRGPPSPESTCPPLFLRGTLGRPSLADAPNERETSCSARLASDLQSLARHLSSCSLRCTRFIAGQGTSTDCK